MVSSVSSLSAPSVVAVPFEHDRPLPDVPENELLQSPLSPSSVLFHDPNGCCQRVALPWTSPMWQLVRRHYGMRLLGASLSWFLWDIAFYGNKLFQSTFLLALTGGSESTTLLVFALAATLNAGVALLGYFGAAYLLDWVGRKQLQQWGFLFTGTLFVGVGFLLAEPNNNNDDDDPKKQSIPLLVCMYLGTSFFGQLGPNATTFLIPAEIVPTELRTLGHGIAAASGKLGALVASLVFARLDQDLTMFLLSGYASFVACAVTYWTLPETAALDLYEHDKKWRLIRLGRGHEYQGAANHPHHLSVYERYTRQRHEHERHGLRLVGHDDDGEHAYWHHSDGG
jgi:MFS family permease